MNKKTAYYIREGVIKKKNLFINVFLPVLVLSLATVGALKISPASANPPPVTAAVDEYSQCSNDQGVGYSTGDLGCRWTNGNLQHNNSTYHEGDSTPQRLAIKDLTDGDHTVTLSYDTTKSGKHAYDFITDDKYSETWITNADMCDAPISKLADCSTTTPAISGLIPTDSNAAGHDVAVTARHFTIRNGSWGTVGAPTLASGTYAGDSETTIQLSFHVNTGTCVDKYQVQNTDVCEVLITFGTHISTQGDWGAGSSAISISGSPYHVALVSMDGNAIGQKDNQMQADAIAQTPVITTELHNDANEAVIALNSTVPSGTSVHDKATVAKTGNSNSFPSGTVTFRFYSTSDACTADTGFIGGTTKGTITLSSGVAHPSLATGALNAGTYAFKAQYNSSDTTTWTDSIGTCEVFTIAKANPTISTTPSSGGAVGTTLNDTATLSGGSSPTGNVTFNLYPPSDPSCSGTASYTSTDSNSPYATSPGFVSNAVGTWHWTAHYDGDSNNNSADSLCAAESVTTTKAAPTVSTTPSAGGVVGITLNDTATLSGGSSPTGDVTFKLFPPSDPTCAGTASYTETDSASPYATTTGFATDSVGTWHWTAHYAGDANNSPADSLCASEAVTITKAQLGISTTVHSDAPDQALVGNLALGGGAHDFATVTGKVGSFTLPNVTFYFFDKGLTCTNGSTTGGTALNSVAPDGTTGVAHPSTSKTNLAAGTYNFMAVVAGNSNYLGATSDCEPFTVNKADSSTVTEIHDANTEAVITSDALGSTVHDKATVSGTTFGTPTGSVDITFYTSSDCTTGGKVTDSGLSMTNGVAHPSSDQGPLAAGSYSFKAHYNGDNNYNGSDGACEPLTVSKADLGINTTVHSDNPDQALVGDLSLGSGAHDSASVTGGNNSFTLPNVTFYFFPKDVACTNGDTAGATTLNTIAPVSGVAHLSTSETGLAAGTYNFMAAVAGNSNYAGATSNCEPFTVDKAQLTVTTVAHDAGHNDITNSSIDLGSVTHDTATLTGGVDGFALPTVSFTLTSNYSDSCDNGSSVANNGPEGGAIKSADSSALGAGAYAYSATVAGNDNYIGNVSSCEPFTVNKAQLGISTDVHDSSHNIVTTVPLGSVVHDRASISGQNVDFTPSGAVTFVFFNDGKCTPDGTVAATTSDVTDPIRSADSTALPAGSYSYQASIASDANYIGATGACEPLTVNQASTSTVTEIHKDPNHVAITSVNLGDSVHDKATVSSSNTSFTIGGTVTYTFYTSGDCTTGGGTPETVAFTAESSTSGALKAGSYSYQAVYNGNSNYTGSTGDCEPLTVNKAALGISTTIHDSLHNAITAAALGSIVHDTADISGQVGSITPTGAVTFYFGPGIAQGDCHNTNIYPVIATAASTDSGNGNPRSVDTSALSAGTYQFWAHIAGDSNYTSANSTCEPLTINKANSSTVTEVHDASETIVSSVPLGSTVHDKATVSGTSFGTPTGNVNFTFFNNGTCDGNGTASGTAIALVSGVAHPSTSQGPLGAGSYSFVAHYNGDSNYNSSDGLCESLTVNKAQLAVTTNVHNAAHADITNGNVPLGSITHDTATVAGGVSGFTVPTPSFTLTSAYTSTCVNGTAVANNGTEGSTAKSADSTALGVGAYAYRAVVAGDANYLGNTSICEPFTVVKGTPSVVTSILDANGNTVTQIGSGSTVHDQAMVTGTNGLAPAGTVDFTFFTNGSCIPSGGTAAGSATIDTSTGIAGPSSSEGPLSGTAFSFRAHYNGDNNYSAKDGACEVLHITPKATPKIKTTPNPSKVTIGGILNDSATLTGGNNPTGKITFKLYAPTDLNCSGTPAFTQDVPVSGAGTYNTNSGFASNTVGTWKWVAIYNGDNNNNQVISGCGCECVTVLPLATRTLGFWQTHFDFTSSVFNSHPGTIWLLCNNKITGVDDVFGGFYASIPRMTNNTLRTQLDQARMQELQQLLAAILNNQAFGQNNGGTLIANAKTAYCDTNRTTIISLTSQLNSFNMSGDTQVLPNNINPGSSNPSASKNLADLAIWNVLP